MTRRPEWEGPSGLPTPHSIRAALQVASILDSYGSSVPDARKSYWQHAAGGTMSATDLQIGESLLVDCGLVVERDGRLHPTNALSMLFDAAVDDATAQIYARVLEMRMRYVTLDDQTVLETAIRNADMDFAKREALLVQLGQRFDNETQRAIGDVGEELALAAFRLELSEIGYDDLARAVRQVSAISDQLGYDISAPRIDGTHRLVEVKATTANETESVTFYISRNEAEVAQSTRDWFLVVIRVTDVARRDGEILGWCAADVLQDVLPRDTPSGRWEQAKVKLPSQSLVPGIPGAL